MQSPGCFCPLLTPWAVSAVRTRAVTLLAGSLDPGMEEGLGEHACGVLASEGQISKRVERVRAF